MASKRETCAGGVLGALKVESARLARSTGVVGHARSTETRSAITALRISGTSSIDVRGASSSNYGVSGTVHSRVAVFVGGTRATLVNTVASAVHARAGTAVGVRGARVIRKTVGQIDNATAAGASHI